ncbi:hypothetical protein [Helicobacter sp. 11S03491-1]|uniref:hypothetical protein n=1 Tax=Helicobacter sp. 11S03491-1 TaxID=1476196 RepID=UPI000BA5E574|nr:hypothetical protein [Helicobacter sp. 11S03491-1]PAF43898.1 hypothetical protein BKH45_01145 [Helicobacter sp. 11S03491-1]
MRFVFIFLLVGQVCFVFGNDGEQKYFEVSDIQIGLFSSGGFGKNQGKPISGGYTNIFGSLDVLTQSFYGFDFGIGISAVALLHKVKNQDVYSNINNNLIGIGFRINNDEAKDFRYTSDDVVFHTLYFRYSNSWGSLTFGRFPLSLDWVGDYAQGVGVELNKFDHYRIRAGWFDEQAYASPEENVHFGYMNKWYGTYEGYHIQNNYYLDVRFKNESIYWNAYYNYFQSLFNLAGIKANWKLILNDWEFKSMAHYVFVSASSQSQEYCKDPNLSSIAGLACYVPGSMGKVNGYLWEIGERVKYQNWYLSLGYLQNDNKGATNNIAIYADDNPLEYNTVIYGSGSKTSYITLKYEYDGKYFLGLKYGVSWYGTGEGKSSQGQFNALGGIDFSHMNVSVAYVNINDVSGYQNNIARIYLGLKF